MIDQLRLQAIALMQQLIAKLSAQLTTSMSKLDQWALAIQQHEGYYAGSRSFRNRNPGNIRCSSFATITGATGCDAQKFAIYPTYAVGFASLKRLLENAATGKSTIYRPDMTLLEFFERYAPSTDGNAPAHYAQTVADKIGVPVKTEIKNLIA